MAQKVAGLYIKLSAESIELIRELNKSAAAIRQLGRQANRQANRVKYAFNKIRRAAQVVASAFIFTAGVRQLGNLVLGVERAEEKIQMMAARLAQFGRSAETFANVYKQSIALGVSIDAVAEGMTRLFVATKSLGTTEQDLLEVQKNIVLLGRAGGTSAEEMKGAMRQLSQGISSNRLSGEELRSVLENLPLVALEIADQLGIGIGEIRKFGAEGKISAAVVIAALKELNIDVSKLPQTFSMATQRIRTEWDLTLAALGRKLDTSGVLDFLERALRGFRLEVLGDLTVLDKGELLRQRDEQLAIVNDLKKKVKEARGPAAIGLQTSLDNEIEKLNSINDALVDMAVAARKAELAQTVRDAAEATESWAESLAVVNQALDEAGAKLSRKNYVKNLIEAPIGEAIDPITGENFGTYDIGGKALFEQASEELDDYIRELEKKQKDAINAANKIIQQNMKPMEVYNAEVAKAKALLDAGLLPFEVFQRERRRLKDNAVEGLEEIKDKSKSTFEEMQEYAKQAARNIQDAFAEFFYDFDNGLKGMVKGFIDAIRRMLANQLALQFMNWLKKIFNLPGINTPKTPTGGGGRATGGPVDANKPYVVGEKGMEIFVPSVSGRVLPAHDSKSFTKYFSSVDNSVRETTRNQMGSAVKASDNIIVPRHFSNSYLQSFGDVDRSIRQDIRNQMGAPITPEILLNIDNQIDARPAPGGDVSVSLDDALKGMAKESATGAPEQIFPDLDGSLKELVKRVVTRPRRQDVMPDIEFRASGGPVEAGKPYIVGESGAELFIPGMSGQVIPNGAAIINNYSFAAGADVATIRREIIPMLERTKEATKAEWLQMRLEGVV